MAVTNVYVDGFNLYHGLKEVVARAAAPGAPVPSWRWLDLHALAARIAPHDQIKRVRYFTARVTSPKYDPQLRQRQQTYIRALSTLSSVSVHYGQFTVQPKRMPLAQPVTKKRQRALNALISNDTDLCEPIRIVVSELNLPVVVVNPRGYVQPAAALQKVASETRRLRMAGVEQSQFAQTLTDPAGTITRPAGW